jgi:hypothetical protein
MNLESIKSIQFSLMKKETDMENGKAEYTKKISAKFVLPPNFPKEEEMFESLVKKIYEDLMTNAPEDADSLGLWVERDTDTLDNAISLNTLIDIQAYSAEKINPIYEFFKMTMTV